MAKEPSQQHVEAAKRRLVHLSGISARTAADEGRILDAAEHRLGVVQQDLATLRPRVNADPAAAARYQDLVLESGQLARVVAQAKKVLSP